MAHAFSQVSHALSLCDPPILIHLPASHGTCRLWDLHLTEEEQQEDGSALRVKFSEDGSLLAVTRDFHLDMWQTSTWERLWSAPCNRCNIDFSPDCLRVLADDRGKFEYPIVCRDGTQFSTESSGGNIHAYDVWSGDALGEKIGRAHV